jgi:uncharacterized membrane protein YdbT with pleckstrin-like domain
VGIMGYVDSNLLSGEQITFQTRLHWIVFGWPVVFALFAALMTAAGAGPASGFFWFLAIAVGCLSLLSYMTSEFAVTTKRVIIKVGALRRRTLELQLSKVESVTVDQGILGRIVGYGTIVVTGTGGTKEPFRRIATPMGFRQAVQASSA